MEVYGSKKIFSGRKVIRQDITFDDLTDLEILCSALGISHGLHLGNKTEIDWLVNYSKGTQDILKKEKPNRDEINNKLVLNHAQMITRKITGYFLGNPIQFISSGLSDKKDLIEQLNIYTQYENKASVDKQIGDDQSITGTAYRIIFKDNEFSGAEDNVPFEDRRLDPSNTYVVYESDITERPLYAVTFYDVVDYQNKYKGVKFYVYTDHGRYTFITQGSKAVTPDDLIDYVPYDVGGIPIIEYPNNYARIGDWELVIGLMDAINTLQSGRLDDVDQVIQSLMVFINAEIDGESYDEMRKKGVVMLKNNEGNPSKIDTITSKLDQQGMHLFAEGLEELLYALVGVPSRKDKGTSGGDTGMAVELRDGWADLETIAKSKELVFKESEKRTLKIILHIFNIGRVEKLSRLDVDIKFSRNKNNNMLVKSQSYTMLLSTQTLTPDDCLSIVDLVSDPTDYIERGKAFWGEHFAKLVTLEAEVEEIVNNENDIDDGDNDFDNSTDDKRDK